MGDGGGSGGAPAAGRGGSRGNGHGSDDHVSWQQWNLEDVDGKRGRGGRRLALNQHSSYNGDN